MYRISSNNRPGCLFSLKLKGAALIGGESLKEGGSYFKERGIIHIKFENFVIFFLKITKNNCHYII